MHMSSGHFPCKTAALRLALAAAAFGGCLAAAGAVGAASAPNVQFEIIDERGLPVRDAVIEVYPQTAPSGLIRFPWKMGMAQRNQEFVPGTLVIAKGSTVAFPNLDRVRHSIYSFSKPARFEIELYGRDQTRTHTFPVAGSVKLGCNIHDNMRGYIRVTDTPFAGKTDSRGHLTLSGMAPGKARITVWHPALRAPRNELASAYTVTAGPQRRRLKVTLR